MSLCMLHELSYEKGKTKGEKEFTGLPYRESDLAIGNQYKTISAEKSGKCWYCILLHINSGKKLFFVFSPKPPKDFVATQKANETILLSAIEEPPESGNLAEQTVQETTEEKT